MKTEDKKQALGSEPVYHENIQQKAKEIRLMLNHFTLPELASVFEIIKNTALQKWNCPGPSSAIAFDKIEHEKICELISNCFEFKYLKTEAIKKRHKLKNEN